MLELEVETKKGDSSFQYIFSYSKSTQHRRRTFAPPLFAISFLHCLSFQSNTHANIDARVIRDKAERCSVKSGINEKERGTDYFLGLKNPKWVHV